MGEDRSSAALAAVMAQVADMTASILEGAVGYRQRCINSGFGDEAADLMAADYHGMCVQLVRQGLTPKK